jgi:hypothetical protein
MQNFTTNSMQQTAHSQHAPITSYSRSKWNVNARSADSTARKIDTFSIGRYSEEHDIEIGELVSEKSIFQVDLI